MEHWKVLRSDYILRKKWMQVREEQVRLPSGHVIDEFHVVEYPDWVCILCLTEANEVVLVHQYRHGVGQVRLELPAGVIDPGEDAATAARRELREETGYESENWLSLGAVFPEPHRHTNKAFMEVAMNARRESGRDLDDSEEIEVEVVAASALSELVFSDRFNHSVHLAALLRAAARGIISL